MYLIQITVFLFLMASCATGPKVTKIGNKTHPALAESKKVEIWYKKPDMKYTEVCSIQIKEKEYGFPRKEQFHGALAKLARECGVADVFVENFEYKEPFVILDTKAILIEKEADFFKDEKSKELFLKAVNEGQLDTVKKVLKKINKNPRYRSLSDSHWLNTSLFVAASKGENCNGRLVYALMNHQSRIESLEMIKKLPKGSTTEGLYFCRDVVAQSFDSIEEKKQFVLETNKIFKTFIDKIAATSNVKYRLNKFIDIYSQIHLDVEQKCQSMSSTKDWCTLKEQMENLSENVDEYILILKDQTQLPQLKKLKQLLIFNR